MKRYVFERTRDIYPSDNGEWVRYEDVKRLLDATREVVDAAKAVRREWTARHVINSPLDAKCVELIMALEELEAK